MSTTGWIVIAIIVVVVIFLIMIYNRLVGLNQRTGQPGRTSRCSSSSGTTWSPISSRR